MPWKQANDPALLLEVDSRASVYWQVPVTWGKCTGWEEETGVRILALQLAALCFYQSLAFETDFLSQQRKGLDGMIS